VSSRNEKSAEAVVGGGGNRQRRAERGGVLNDMTIRHVSRQMPASAGRSEAERGEAARGPGSDETCRPCHEPGNTGPGLLMAVLARENLLQAWKRVRANKVRPLWTGWTLTRPPHNYAPRGPSFGTNCCRGRIGQCRCDA